MSTSSDDDTALELINLINMNYYNNNHSNNRQYWIHPYWREKREKQHGAFNIFKELHFYPERFQSFYRMNPNTFKLLLEKVGPSIKKLDTFRDSVPPEERLLITLR